MQLYMSRDFIIETIYKFIQCTEHEYQMLLRYVYNHLKKYEMCDNCHKNEIKRCQNYIESTFKKPQIISCDHWTSGHRLCTERIVTHGNNIYHFSFKICNGIFYDINDLTIQINNVSTEISKIDLELLKTLDFDKLLNLVEQIRATSLYMFDVLSCVEDVNGTDIRTFMNSQRIYSNQLYKLIIDKLFNLCLIDQKI